MKSGKVGGGRWWVDKWALEKGAWGAAAAAVQLPLTIKSSLRQQHTTHSKKAYIIIQ